MNPVVSVLIAFAVLVVGFWLLVKGADYFVDGASAVARRLRIPPLIVGLTIVSMGASESVEKEECIWISYCIAIWSVLRMISILESLLQEVN